MLRIRLKFTACLIYLFGISVAIGCGGRRELSVTLDDYAAVHESARSGLPIAVQFEELFAGETDHFITHFGLTRNRGAEELKWNSLALFGGRYNLQMEIPVLVDYDSKRVTRAGNPVFGLREYTHVGDDAGLISSNSRTLAIFGEAEWKKIYKSGGDFSVIGVKINRGAPLPGFEKLVQAATRPLVPVTLLSEDRKNGL